MFGPDFTTEGTEITETDRHHGNPERVRFALRPPTCHPPYHPLASPFGDFGTCTFPTTPARYARALALGLAIPFGAPPATPPRSLPPSGTSGPAPSPPPPLATLAPSRSASRDGAPPARVREAHRAGRVGRPSRRAGGLPTHGKKGSDPDPKPLLSGLCGLCGLCGETPDCAVCRQIARELWLAPMGGQGGLSVPKAPRGGR